ncbi:26S proteasome non-ATPase regulatory subunit 11 [Capsicum chinense]|nr:26S proteasome non-ATPase regulatory subunit 11 [Capsicum chinense]
MENNFLHVWCNAHILNLIVKKGLSEQNKSISWVRNVVKYVKPSCARTASFKSYVEKVKLDTNGLMSLDVEIRWNSTYLMLNTAAKFEKAFSRMYVDDHKYLKYCLDSNGKIEHTSSKDWKDVNVFLNVISEIDAVGSSDVWQSQWEKYFEKESNVDDKFDLEKYLKDDVEKIKDFNILNRWKASLERYPIVSRIARDVLAIPTSTVASESVFSTGSRVLDCYRSSLSAKTVEALICGQQWLRSTSKECKIEDLLEEIQNLETMDLLESKLQFSLRNLPKAKDALKAARTGANALFIHPDQQGIISSCGLEYLRPELDTMKDVVNAYSSTTSLYDTSIEQNLCRLIEPFSRVESANIAELIEFPADYVVKKLSQMILHKKFPGTLDQGAGCLVNFEDPKQDAIYPSTLEAISSMSKVVESLFIRSSKIMV